MSNFDLLSSALQYQIVNGLGFRALRPVQEQSIPPILAGHNCVVLAPTAGGKTESAFFPLLSAMDTGDWRPVSVVYVAPLRALLNNQAPRLERYAGLLGRRAFKWHGDTTAAERRAFLNEPVDILLTTPESLEVMLMSERVPTRRLFSTLRAVVIDEIHAFVGDDRGGHLSAVLERLSRIAGHDVQRIGLSATVGNPEEILAWTAGSSTRSRSVVAPGGARAEPELSLDYVGSLENAAHVITRLHPGKKRLVFVDSRRGVEAVGRALRDSGVEAFVTHSSLSIHERRAAEEAFAGGKDCVIVATSALELGIDIGDLDHVLQVDSPSTVAGFLQRMGRSGRRDGTRPNCTFLATDSETLVQAAALLRLHRAGYVEPIEPVRRASHLLAHQLMALSIQEHGVAESDWWGWVAPASAFAGLADEDRAELVGHMESEGILARAEGRLLLGDRGQKLYGFRNFMELYSAFSTPKSFGVMYGADEIGTLELSFVEDADLANLSFTLGARAWKAIDIDWTNAVVRVEPAPMSGDAKWQGSPKLLGRALCEAIREVLTSDTVDPWWSRRAREHMASVRAEYGFLSPSGLDLVRDRDSYRLWTYAGGRANNLLAKLLEEVLGPKVTSGNFSLGFKENAAASEAAIRQALDQLRQSGRPTEEDAIRYAEACARGRLSKFQPCLSERLEAVYLAARLTDAEGARAALAPSRVETHGDRPDAIATKRDVE